MEINVAFPVVHMHSMRMAACFQQYHCDCFSRQWLQVVFFFFNLELALFNVFKFYKLLMHLNKTEYFIFFQLHGYIKKE